MSSTDGRAERTEPVARGATQSGNPLVASVVRLVPFSGIQFIDLTLPMGSLSSTIGRFVEERDPIDGSFLLTLTERPDSDGVEWHPVTGERLAPHQTLWLTGYQALEPFLGVWFPVPYFRFLGRNEDGGVRFDQGPVNWARLFIEPPVNGLSEVRELNIVLALDTSIAAASRAEQPDYLAPNADDVVFAPVFRMASESGDLDEFLAGAWCDDWLSGLLKCWRARQQRTGTPVSGPSSAQPTAEFAFEHAARYLTLLKVLEADARMPQLQFIDVRVAHWQARSGPLDLMLDIGSPDTVAMLVEQGGEAAGLAPPRAEPLRLRDLSCPTLVHSGPFRTLAEFQAASFGDDAASRRSGRADAFYWPSLVRVGSEGVRLSHAESAVAGTTGLGNLIRGLAQTRAHGEVWRFGKGENAGEDPGRMVGGALLQHLSDDGRIVGEGSNGLEPALRPNFSPASVLSMFIAECVLHAISAANDPAWLAVNGRVRRLKRIVVSATPAASEDERRQLKSRVEDAVSMIWSALGWDKDDHVPMPERPEVSLTFDGSRASQVIYLYDEIQNRHGGSVAHFNNRVRKTSSPRERWDGVRVASLDLSGQATSLTIVRYQPGADGGLRPIVEIADRSGIGGDSVTEAVMKAHVLPAIAAALERAGHPDGTELLTRLGDAMGSGGALHDRHFSARFLRKVLLPAASALIDLHRALPDRAAASSVRRMSIDHLVRLGGGRMAPLDAKLEALAGSEGAVGFRLGAVVVHLNRRAMTRTIEKHLGVLMARVSDAVSASHTDVLVLAGAYGDLKEVTRSLHERLPIAPHRIVSLAKRWDGFDELQAATSAQFCGPRYHGVVAASLSGRKGDGHLQRIGALAEELAYAIPERRSAGLPAPDGDGGSFMALPRVAERAVIGGFQTEAPPAAASDVP